PTFFSYCYAHHRDLHSFPTRRSSDLPDLARPITVWTSPGRAPRWSAGVSASWYHHTTHSPCPKGRSRRSQIYGSPPVLARSRERSEEHTSELQSRGHLVCRLLLEKKK